MALRTGGAERDTVSPLPLVSAITPFLDAERFLEEAIQSVLRQTYDRWELLLVDDGSTDGSPNIARRYAREHPARIRYLRHPDSANHGMSASRNLGITAAAGPYIAFLDADDVWQPEKLEHQTSILAALPEVALVYGPTRLWYGWTGFPGDAARDTDRRLGLPPETLIVPPRMVELYLRDIAETPATCGVLLRRDAIDEVGGFEASFTSLYEDQAFFYKVALRRPIFVTSRCTDRYRQHPESCCAVAERTGALRYGAPHAAEQRLLEWLGRHMAAHGVGDRAVWDALESRLWPYRHPTLHRLGRAWATIAASLRRRPGPPRTASRATGWRP